jgi:hypothetical protein
LCDQRLNSRADVIADRPHTLDRSLRIVERPVIAPQAGHVRALVAASHRDQELCTRGQLRCQLLGAHITKVDSVFVHDLHDLGMDPVAGRVPAETALALAGSTNLRLLSTL